MIDKRRFTCKADKESALREIGILTSLQTYQSSRLPRLVQVTEDDHQYYLVMGYVEGGNLASFRQSKHCLLEDHIQAIARSLLLSVAELHRLSVAHFNLSPDNILLGPNHCDVVLCDFGCAWDLQNTNFTTITNTLSSMSATIHSSSSSSAGSTSPPAGNSVPRCGTLQYAAPEVIGSCKEFGLATDMWSVGVILYELFCGRLPFEDVSKRALKGKIASGKYKFNGKEWHQVSRGAKQFISTLLHPDPQVRMTVGEALTHPWMTQPVPGSIANDAPRDGVRSKSSSRDKRRPGPSLVQRLLGRLRPDYAAPASSSSSSRHSSATQPMALKSKNNAESSILDLSLETTLSAATTVSQSSIPDHPLSNERSWEATVPRPLDDYRRPSLVGL